MTSRDEALLQGEAAVPVAWIWDYTDGHRSLRWRPDYDPTSSDVPSSVTPLYLSASPAAPKVKP